MTKTSKNLARHFVLLLGVGAALGTLAGRVDAQDFERYRPRTLPTDPGRAELPPSPELPGGDPTIVLDELKSIVIVDDPDRVVKDRALDITEYPAGLHFEPAGAMPLLRSQTYRKIADSYLGKPVSVQTLNDFVRETIQFYRRHDRPVVDVSVPEQNIKNGVIQIVVVEGRLGKICVQGTNWFDPDVMLRNTRTPNSRTIRESTLLADVDWLNQNPFRRVDLELKPGREFGETDVFFNVKDKFPIRGYVGYEDTGTQATELERLLFGFNYGNAFGRDHQLAYQYTASPDFQTLSSHTAIYSIPLLNRDQFNLFGSYATVQSDLPPFGQNGLAWQASWRYKYVLGDWGSLKHNFNVGFDFKKTNTNLDFGGFRVFGSSADIAQMAFGYQAAVQRTGVATAWGTDFYVSPGGFSSGNSDADFNVIRPGATANYLYNRTFIERERVLPYQLLLVSRLTGQLSNENLLPSETLGFGGYGSIRGYDQRIVNGDSGFIGNLEVRTKAISLLNSPRKVDQFQLLCFYDFGQSYFHSAPAGAPDGFWLQGVGVGTRYSIAQNLTFRCDYGWQLNEVPLDFNSSRVHLGLVLSR